LASLSGLAAPFFWKAREHTTTGKAKFMTEFFRVKNWRRFQHYKDRNPPWIKLHVEILQSQDWVMLADASKLLAVVCMIIASRNEGMVPNSPAFLKRIAYLDKEPNLKPLIECGFLEKLQADASECKQQIANARPETYRTETEKENIQKKDIPAKGTHLSPEWQPSSVDRAYAADRGFNAGQIDNLTADFVEHFTNGKGRTQTRPEWSRSRQRWVRQDIEWHGPPETRKARPVEEEPLTPEEIAALERARKGNGGLKVVVPPAAPFAEYNALADELPDCLRRT